jgi:uncharacterized protein
MHLVGAPHPHKADSQQLLERAIADGERLVTDPQVVQESLHRYVAIGRRDAIQPALEAILGVAGEVYPVDRAVVLRARAGPPARQSLELEGGHVALDDERQDLAGGFLRKSTRRQGAPKDRVTREASARGR